MMVKMLHVEKMLLICACLTKEFRDLLKLMKRAPWPPVCLEDFTLLKHNRSDFHLKIDVYLVVVRSSFRINQIEEFINSKIYTAKI